MFHRKIMLLLLLFQQNNALTGVAGSSPAVPTPKRNLAAGIKIAGYEPQSDVADPLRIDLDQQQIEVLLKEGDFESALDVYSEGGYSRPYANLHVPPLKLAILEGTKLKVVDSDGRSHEGMAMNPASPGDRMVLFQYTQTDCNIGGLPVQMQVKEGCLPETGYLQIAHQNEITYSYTPGEENHNDRTLASFSTGAREMMHDCGLSCPYAAYETYLKYYGHFQYGHVFVTAARDGISNANLLKRGAADFSGYSDKARAVAFERGIVYLNLWMYVVRELERALDYCDENCDTCKTDSLRALDSSVAFYTGSLEQSVEDENDGLLLYALADKMCISFRTCGEDSNALTGTSKINIEIFRRFKALQNDLRDASCESARSKKDEIEKLMIVPLVQGTLRSAWINDFEADAASDTENAIGAAFVASILPLVHACSPTSAEVLYNNMRTASETTDFGKVKHFLEKNYKCMGLDGDLVGGLYDSASNRYFQHASPYGTSSHSKTTVILATVIPGVFAGLLVVYAFVKRRGGRKEVPEITSADDVFVTQGVATIT